MSFYNFTPEQMDAALNNEVIKHVFSTMERYNISPYFLEATSVIYFRFYEELGGYEHLKPIRGGFNKYELVIYDLLRSYVDRSVFLANVGSGLTPFNAAILVYTKLLFMLTDISNCIPLDDSWDKDISNFILNDPLKTGIKFHAGFVEHLNNYLRAYDGIAEFAPQKD